MRILITGSNGLLGQKIVAQLLAVKKDFLATSKGYNRNPDCPTIYYRSLDITSLVEIAELFDSVKVDVIINTAAMTNVDACEEDESNCRKINVEAVANLHKVASEKEIFLIHISTDFVFDGQNGPYAEEDLRNPLNVYATSKCDSEDILVQANYTNWAILRTIIVFGKGNNQRRSNIVLWAKESLKEGKAMRIVDDQYRAPTWADDLAWASIRAAELKAKGVFHISGPETFSIYELVCRIADFYGWDKSTITPISSSTLNQKAKRPPKTGFDISKAQEILGYQPLTLEESLKQLDS